MADGLALDGLVLVNARVAPPELAGRNVKCVPASELAAIRIPSSQTSSCSARSPRLLGEPSLDSLGDAMTDELGRKDHAR